MTPVGLIQFNWNTWQIEFNRKIFRPKVDSYIRFYTKSTNQQVYAINVYSNTSNVTYSNRTLTFTTSIIWNLVNQHRYSFETQRQLFIDFRMKNIILYSIGQSEKEKNIKIWNSFLLVLLLVIPILVYHKVKPLLIPIFGHFIQ